MDIKKNSPNSKSLFVLTKKQASSNPFDIKLSKYLLKLIVSRN